MKTKVYRKTGQNKNVKSFTEVKTPDHGSFASVVVDANVVSVCVCVCVYVSEIKDRQPLSKPVTPTLRLFELISHAQEL